MTNRAAQTTIHCRFRADAGLGSGIMPGMGEPGDPSGSDETGGVRICDPPTSMLVSAYRLITDYCREDIT